MIDSDTYLQILSSAMAALAFEEKYPTNDVTGFSFGSTDAQCESKGMTPENSKFAYVD